MLHPGTCQPFALNHRYDTGTVDIALASAWLSKHQHEITPKEGRFLLPDFVSKVSNKAKSGGGCGHGKKKQ